MSYNAHRLLKGIVGVSVLAAASTAFALQEARTMLVTASIQGGCTLVTLPMAFGNLNVATPTTERQTVRASYRCAQGISVTGFSINGNSSGIFGGVMTGITSGQTIPYTITWDTATVPFTSANFATAHEVVLNGSILPNDYSSKATDSYSQSVTVAIEF